VRLKRIAKLLTNRLAKPWGFEFVSSHLVMRPQRQLDWLKRLRIRTVLDIGANTGQFAARIRGSFPESVIYSFEPLRDAYASLRSRMGADPAFKAFNFALGDKDATTLMHRSGVSDSSSVLRMLQLHTAAFPNTALAGTEEIEVRRLDALNFSLEPGLLVKIDVQGFEDRVIRGGRATIGGADCVITEVSFDKLYEEQPLFDDIYHTLRDMGFEYSGSLDQLLDPRDGRPLQADAIFLKPEKLR
jgi:FkbM family methyltransferase